MTEEDSYASSFPHDLKIAGCLIQSLGYLFTRLTFKSHANLVSYAYALAIEIYLQMHRCVQALARFHREICYQ